MGNRESNPGPQLLPLRKRELYSQATTTALTLQVQIVTTENFTSSGFQGLSDGSVGLSLSCCHKSHKEKKRLVDFFCELFTSLEMGEEEENFGAL